MKSNICHSDLSVESTFVVWISMKVIFHNHKIGCRSIQWCWVAPFATEIVTGVMIDIVIRINYKSRCLLPNVPRMIADSSSEYHTSLVNTNVAWSQAGCTLKNTSGFTWDDTLGLNIGAQNEEPYKILEKVGSSSYQITYANIHQANHKVKPFKNHGF